MQIIFSSDESPEGEAPRVLAVGGRRLAMAGLIFALAAAAATYAAARHLAASWLRERAPVALSIAADMEKRRQQQQLQLQEDNRRAFQEQIALLNARVIQLQNRGAALAERLGLPEQNFAATPPTCDADNFAPENNEGKTAATSAKTSPSDSQKVSAAESSESLSPAASASPSTLAVAAGLDAFEGKLQTLRRRYDVLLQHGANTLARYSTVPMKRPVRGRNWLSSRFGKRRDPITGRPGFHAGYDYAARKGTPVLAGATGIVSYAGRLGNYGNAVRIDHGDSISTLYSHLHVISVADGDYVRRGQIIGQVGSTGRSTGPHLHYEIRRANRPRPVNSEVNRLRKQRGVPKNWEPGL